MTQRVLTVLTHLLSRTGFFLLGSITGVAVTIFVGGWYASRAMEEAALATFPMEVSSLMELLDGGETSAAKYLSFRATKTMSEYIAPTPSLLTAYDLVTASRNYCDIAMGRVKSNLTMIAPATSEIQQFCAQAGAGSTR